MTGSPSRRRCSSWDLSDTGLVVRALMTVSAEAVVLLADGQVWVSTADGDRGVTIFAGVAQPVDSTTLEVTGVVALVREQRRRAPRTSTPAGVSVSSSDRIRQMRAIDLSRGGVRVALGADSDLHLGEHVELDVHLEDGATVTASGEVTRVDEQAGQARRPVRRPARNDRRPDRPLRAAAADRRPLTAAGQPAAQGASRRPGHPEPRSSASVTGSPAR